MVDIKPRDMRDGKIEVVTAKVQGESRPLVFKLKDPVDFESLFDVKKNLAKMFGAIEDARKQFDFDLFQPLQKVEHKEALQEAVKTIVVPKKAPESKKPDFSEAMHVPENVWQKLPPYIQKERGKTFLRRRNFKRVEDALVRGEKMTMAGLAKKAGVNEIVTQIAARYLEEQGYVKITRKNERRILVHRVKDKPTYAVVDGKQVDAEKERWKAELEAMRKND